MADLTQMASLPMDQLICSPIVATAKALVLIFWMDSEMPPVLPLASPPAPRKSRSWLFIVLSLARAA